MRRTLAVLLGLAVAGCSPEEQADPLPPTDRFYFPTGVATSRVTGGTALLVASSNFDLRYSASEGGTLLSLLDDGTLAEGAVSPVDVERIASYAGSVVVADGATCPELAAPTALVASRYDDVLYRFGLGSGGELSCGTGCVRQLDGRARDPYAIAVACGPARQLAYVAFLETPESTRGSGNGAWIAEVDLANPAAAHRTLEIGDGPVRSMAYERTPVDRLWFATRSSGQRAILYSVNLSDPTWLGSTPWAAVDSVDLFPAVRGVELRSLVAGTYVPGQPRRLYASARLYDVESQTANDARPSGDVGGVLLVLEVTDGMDGRPVVQVRQVVSLGTGVGDVAVVARSAPSRDVVVVTQLTGDLLYVYDAETEAMALVIGHDALGLPLLGDRPMALAVDQLAADAAATVYVAAFGDHAVTRFVVDPLDLAALDPLQADTLKTIGGLAP